MRTHSRAPDDATPAHADDVPTRPVGRRSLTQRHAARVSDTQRAAEHARLDAAWANPPVQLARDRHTGLDNGGVQAAAAHGLTAPGGSLPHLAAIQRSFGPHDVGSVTAHVGGAARDASEQLGAHAYATGDHVAFAEAPSLFLAAHEAAHVVQQRGGVQLSSAVGQAGDSYEQQADAVAARVVAGESAAELLGPVASGGGASVQREEKPAADKQRGVDRLVGLAGRCAVLTPEERSEAEDLILHLPLDEFRAFLAHPSAQEMLVAFLGADALAIMYGKVPSKTSLTAEVRINAIVIGGVDDIDRAEVQLAAARALFELRKVGIELEWKVASIDPADAVAEIGKDQTLADGGFDDYKLTREIEKVIDRFASTGAVSVIWVPRFAMGHRGLTITPELWGEAARGRATVLMDSSNSGDDTLAHELGHLLGADLGAGPHLTPDGDDQAGENLMAPANKRAEAKNVNELSAAQIAEMRRCAYITLGRKGHDS